MRLNICTNLQLFLAFVSIKKIKMDNTGQINDLFQNYDCEKIYPCSSHNKCNHFYKLIWFIIQEYLPNKRIIITKYMSNHLEEINQSNALKWVPLYFAYQNSQKLDLL